MENNKIAVGILGLGRSGWGIHCRAIRNNSNRFQVAAVYDPITDRRNQVAKDMSCKAYTSVEELLADDEIEMVIVSSPNAFHAPHAVQALNAGKHVLCEKPFGLVAADVDAMIKASEKAGKVLQPFQQRRFEPDFQKVKELCESGLFGDIKLIRICWNGFKRRWDWQTTREMSGGALNNNGPHPIDHAMVLFGGGDPDVRCEMKHCLCSGDAEDYLKVVLSGKGRPTIEIELIDCIPHEQDRWLIGGTEGGLRGTGTSLEWKWVDWSTMPERPLSLEPTPDRSYNSEQVQWQTGSWERQAETDAGAGAAPSDKPVMRLYENLYDVIRNEAAQIITPQEVRSRVVVLEKARKSAAE
ncbi:MAG: Gfo/Idh/MocA family oxidoreductase [Spirochaetales bacterium]|jgi:scyllo-inositol 2-dehydrogenase (NADP+)|nr:Gfo/Idh/MocA family oxidoreductase [Spirochaetales bacterium]